MILRNWKISWRCRAKVRRLGVVAGPLMAVFGSGFALPVLAESASLPDTPIGRHAAGWMALCRQPVLEKMAQWASASLSANATAQSPAAARAQEDVDFCSKNGGLRIDKVVQATDARIVLITAGSTSGIWFRTLFAADETGKVDAMASLPTTPPESALPAKLDDAALARELNLIVAKYSQAGIFSGIVAVSRGPRQLVSASGGYADRKKRTPFTGDSRFTLGSLGKIFTAVAVAQLVDQGRLSFDDKVGKVFPDYPNATIRDQATVGMLLAHTAGMGDFLDRRTPAMMKDGVKRAAEFMPLYDHDEPQFPPGTAWSYSNAGFALAGAIVEKMSGEYFPDYVRRHIFQAAGMTRSDPNNVPHASTSLVTPYTQMSESGAARGWEEAEHDIGSPAGGAVSTANDLLRFADALHGGKLVSKASFDAMARVNTLSPAAFRYGYALEVEDVYGRTVVGHGGGFPGVSTHVQIILDSPYSLVVLSNQDPPAATYVKSVVTALMVEKAKRKE